MLLVCSIPHLSAWVLLLKNIKDDLYQAAAQQSPESPIPHL